jgi:hypothetical protein
MSNRAGLDNVTVRHIGDFDWGDEFIGQREQLLIAGIVPRDLAFPGDDGSKQRKIFYPGKVTQLCIERRRRGLYQVRVWNRKKLQRRRQEWMRIALKWVRQVSGSDYLFDRVFTSLCSMNVDADFQRFLLAAKCADGGGDASRQ